MTFSDLQKLLEENFGINHLADIARELNVSPQAVSNWKARDRVPYKYVINIRERLDNDERTYNPSMTRAHIIDGNSLNSIKSDQYFKEDTVSLVDIILILSKNLRLIIVTAIIFCIITIIHVKYYVPSVYISKAKIMSSSGSSSKSLVSGIAAQFGISLPSVGSESQWVIPEIIKSRTLAKSMLKRKFNTERYGLQKSLLQILTFGNEEPSEGIDTLIKEGVDSFIGMIYIGSSGSFYDLQISAPEPVFARDLAVALIEELDNHQRDYNYSKVIETRHFIEDRIAKIEKELNATEEALKVFRDRNRRIGNSPALLLEQERISREVSVLIGVFTTLKQQLETTKIEQVKESDYVIVLDPPEAPLERSGPKKKKMVIIGGLMGIAMGIVLGFIKESFSNYDNENQKKMKQIKTILSKYFVDLTTFRKKSQYTDKVK